MVKFQNFFPYNIFYNLKYPNSDSYVLTQLSFKSNQSTLSLYSFVPFQSAQTLDSIS